MGSLRCISLCQVAVRPFSPVKIGMQLAPHSTDPRHASLNPLVGREGLVSSRPVAWPGTRQRPCGSKQCTVDSSHATEKASDTTTMWEKVRLSEVPREIQTQLLEND